MDTTKIPVLDNGYIQYIEHMGSDERFIEAARMSVDKGFISWDPYEGHPKGDAGLLAHLWFNNHSTPFEMGGIVIEVMAPIMVFREWHRHRTQGYGEMSARYVPLPNVNYVPSAQDAVERSEAAAASANKQARAVGVKVLDIDTAISDILDLQDVYDRCQEQYEQMLDHGWPKELARLPTPVARYSRMRAVANPLNWLKFLTLRRTKMAQKEIRVYAETFSEFIFKPLFPRTHALWEEGMTLWAEFQEWKKAQKSTPTV